ncbi:MAG TPA: TolC family protein [Steroidobacteraceae bacterium]|nr:TolC family protein [Steroidobacteraceae bacterium]
MTKSRKPVAVVVGMALVLGAMGASGETLTEAWARAAQQDHSIAAVRSQTEAAKADAAAARAQRWPQLSVGGSYLKLDQSPAFDFSFTGLPIKPPPMFSNNEVLMGSATLTIPLFTSGRISSSVAAAEAHSRGAGDQLVAAESDLKLAVADAYVGVLRARKALAVAESNVASLESLANDVRSMFERELVPKNDLLAVQVALADAKQNRLRAANNAEVAVAAYNRRLGEPMDRPVELAETLPDPDGLPSDLATLTELAMRQRTELAALDEQAKAYGQMANTERARVLPQLAVTGGYNYLENQFLNRQDVLSAGIGVQWAVFDGGQARKRAAALDHTRRATEQQRQDAETLVQLQVRQSWLEAAAARERSKVAAETVEQSEENLRIAHERYGAGLGTQTQLLEAETLRVQALTNRDTANLDAGLARLRLARSVGAL